MQKCAREECGKTVYPMEELKCLDKIWHKGCFKCTSCGMTLNMKNYKGYNKMPYCDPHYPKTVATSVVDTPDMQRVAQNTKLQSQVAYHLEYEKNKGHKTDIVDDPELKRHAQNTKNASQVLYTGEIDKKQKQELVRPKEDPNAAPKEEPKKIGSISDYDPVNGNFGSLGGKQAEPVAVSPTPSTGSEKKVKKVKKSTKNAGFSVKCLYDYTAADSDEISFKEGDIIVNCQTVDEGWMTGTHQKSLAHGMLPANYVEKISVPTGAYKLS
ncbi:unnamed protein product [Bursaphelenchus xylophilus]|uniref:(pine wood nematode) hypothetical protein n=1 Tax=Bursaphelenchus xylophilus TaxID=6326 RepID=A0A1I7RZZ6_BURXY|nr:unnamed protein product [Bursaphelenchus xylophilus]CAG9109126.1 unnamed protein product [Bursaphelenchus xylophilus]